MFPTDQPTAVSSIPTPAAAGTQGFFTGGNPGSGEPATIVDADWLNMIQQELVNVVTAAGLTPSKTTYTQVLSAIRLLVQQQTTPSIAVTVASNALTGVVAAPELLIFRNPTLSSGAPVVASIGSNLTLTVPSGATLGSVSGNSSRIVWLVAYNGGSPALCVVNLSGGLNLDETTLISATAITSGATAANVIYSATAISSSPFRVVGFSDVTETTAGTWATGPTTVQGMGGQALAALSSFGFGQTWQSFTSSTRALVTTYYNTTGKPIQVVAALESSNSNNFVQIVVNGVAIIGSTAATALTVVTVTATIPPGGSYIVSGSAGGETWSAWAELR